MFNSFNDCDLSYPLPTLVKANEYSFISVLRTNIKPHTTQGTVNMFIFLYAYVWITELLRVKEVAANFKRV